MVSRLAFITSLPTLLMDSLFSSLALLAMSRISSSATFDLLSVNIKSYILVSVLQIRRGKRDNLGKISNKTPFKTYVEMHH